ncbi:MAG: TetR/AcrR family transcriptional regulator [Burkholderiales bacterium]|nr:TetR/AcrR family transcriptional regulator [Burkholderiales bacterium]
MSKPYHHGNLKEALLQAARARLAENAEADLSLRDLAARVGVSVNATYRHFASKDAMLMELAAGGFDALRADMLDAMAAAGAVSAVSRLNAAGEAYVAFANREPALFRLMFGRGGRFKSDERLSEAARAAFLTLVEVVATVRNQPPESPEVFKAAIAAWSVVHGYATLGLEGYLQALPAAHRPSAREVVGRLDVNDGE